MNLSRAFKICHRKLGLERFFSTQRPQHVGIVGMDIYFPRTYVNQSALESFDKVGKGKYTIGLGQHNMAFVDDREDINSMCLTVVHSLLEKYNINPKDVGRLEVGTETIIDKSKATKTTLMKLFEASGNFSIEGIDTHNACYGGTNALFNALNWVYSPFYDGRYAIVVAGDIAVYESGPARPTGGCGVVGMIIGPNASLPIETPLRGTYMEDAYDFYKPNLGSEYPLVDGKLSITCYYRALDNCYNQFRSKFQHVFNKKFQISNPKCVDYVLFHSPYSKLVFRSLSRLFYNDALATNEDDPQYRALQPFKNLSTQDSYMDKDLMKVLDAICKPIYDQKVAHSQVLSQELGNTYCGSLYCNLLSLLTNKQENELLNKRLMLFSYGSGLASSIFSIVPRKPSSSSSSSHHSSQHLSSPPIHCTLSDIAKLADVNSRLSDRIKVTPEQFSEALALRENAIDVANYTPSGNLVALFPNTYQLEKIDLLKRRTYFRTKQ